MTAVENRPVNGHRMAPPPDLGGELDRLDLDRPTPDRAPAPMLSGVPSLEHLAALRSHAAEVIAVQDAPELREAKKLDEITAEIDLAAEHRGDLLALQRKRNRALIAQGERELATEVEISRAAHRDKLEAAKANALLNRLTSPVGYLAAQMRARRLSLILTALPAVVAVLLGSVQVQSAVTELLKLKAGDPISLALFGLEPLFTLPLVAILIYQAAAPGGSPTNWREVRSAKFFLAEVGLLGASITINVGPHVLLHQAGTAAVWLAVPATILLTLNLLPRLAQAYAERIMDARMEAKLGAPTGRLSGTEAKHFRQAGMILRAMANGEIGGERDEHGLPSNNQMYKALRLAQDGRGSREDAVTVAEGIRLLHGVEPTLDGAGD